MPFSFWRLPVGTTRLEFVTSGRSVVMPSFAVGQASALAFDMARIVNIDRQNNLRMFLFNLGRRNSDRRLSKTGHLN
jgi:hypothetical protein